VGFSVVHMDELEWTDRPPEGGDAIRRVAGLTDLAGFEHSRANLWRYEPGAKGRRHKDLVQEETFVVVRGTLTMYLGEEQPERVEVPAVGLVHVQAGTVLQIANETDEELLLYIYGAPPEHGNAEFFDSVA
jgi:mannose-6-phosphate isomerase-like protein (cupin superfamily)